MEKSCSGPDGSCAVDSSSKYNAAKPRRILLIFTEFPPRIGGMQAHALYLARHLTYRGYQIEVLTYQPASPQERDASYGSDRTLGFPVCRVLSRLGYWHNLLRILKLAERFGPDLIYCSTVFYGLLKEKINVPLLCRSVGNDVMRPWIAYPFKSGSRLLSQPWLDTELYNFFNRFDYPEFLELLFRRRRFDLMQQAAQRMDLVVANSAFTAELLTDIGVSSERIEILVGGVDVSRFTPPAGLRRKETRNKLGLPERALILTTACRLVAKKGIDFLLPAFAKLRRKLPYAHLVVVGDGPHAYRYRRLAQELLLTEHVTFTGPIPHQEIHPYFWASDLFVLASRVQHNPTTGLKDAETMGRVLCEANAAGLPVLAAASGGIPSVITDGDNGLLFTPDDYADFERQLLRLQQPQLVQSLVARGLELARQRFDWSHICTVHEGYFQRFLEPESQCPAGEGVCMGTDATDDRAVSATVA